MNGQACMPCAKRKVRCDRGDPCQNCKRRKQDTCVYPEVSPADRIRKLEDMVRSLGGDPEGHTVPRSQQSIAERHPLHPYAASHSYRGFVEDARHVADVNPVIVEGDDGKKVYLESSAWSGWQGWDGKGSNLPTRHVHRIRQLGGFADQPTTSNILQSIIRSNDLIQLQERHPSPREAEILWEAYELNVDPILGLTFSWELEPLKRRACLNTESNVEFSVVEHTLLFSIYHIAIYSLSKDVCLNEFGHDKMTLLTAYQLSYEQGLARSGFMTTSDLMILQSMVMFAASGVDRLCTATLWSLMGVATRIAQRLGLHRDGTVLNLPPVETEKRRRIWWGLQNVDCSLSVRTGHTSLTLMGTWDTQLPFNIEDEDLMPGINEFPKPRKAITKMSFSLWILTIVNRQRARYQSTTGWSWPADKMSSESVKLGFIDELEDETNRMFLQYCDPVKPLHLVLQISARATMCGLRRMVYHPVPDNKLSAENADRQHSKLVDACIKCLEYDAAFYAQAALRRYDWFILNFFPWGALICVVLEVGRQQDPRKIREIWNILESIYTFNFHVSDFERDPRRVHAAEIVVHAWKTSSAQPNASAVSSRKPPFVSDLQDRLAEYYSRTSQNDKPSAQSGGELNAASRAEAARQTFETSWAPEGLPHGLQLDDLFSLDIDKIDWSFWSSMDNPTDPFSFEAPP